MIDENKKTAQETIFDEINAASRSVNHLAGYVQNDFQRMLDDSTITKDQIINSIPEITQAFNNAIKTLENLKIRTALLINSYANDRNILEVGEGEWFFYVDIKCGPVCVINNNMFRIIDNRVVSMKSSESITIVKKDLGGYVVSSTILPITKLT